MKKIKYVGLGILGFFGLLVSWGLIEPYFIDKEEKVAAIPKLPQAWQGKRVAQISDFQVGMWLDNTNTIRRIVDDLIAERPAVVLISGDFIYHAHPNPEEQIQTAVELVQPLAEAGIPTYAVLGNHDYGMSGKQKEPKLEQAARLEAALEDVGIPVLKNESVTLPVSEEQGKQAIARPASSLYLVGIGARWPNNDKPEVALAQVPDTSPRIVMMHNPDSFAGLPPQTAPLAVAGHTHGGQIRLPFTPSWSWLSFAKEDEVHADGWIKNYGESGNRLYVNRGIGFSGVPIRINCAPEVTVFTLQSSMQS